MEALFQWIPTYGYGMIFLLLVAGVVGLPIPDETLLVFCGYLISKGTLNPVGTFCAALAGSWGGISLSYTIGRTLGLGAVHRFGKYMHLDEATLEKVHQWFDRIGHWALFLGYFIAGVRHFTAIIAGTSKLDFLSFAKYAWPGGLLWVSTFLTLGYFLGENWKRIAESIHTYVLYVSIALLLAAVGYVIFRKTRQAKST